MNYPNWILDVYSADKFLVFIVAEDKKIFIDNQIFSVYRIHDGGVSKMKLSRLEKKNRLINHINGLTMINEYFGVEHVNWYQTNLKYFSLIEANMDTDFLQKLSVLIINIPFFIRNRRILNYRIILGHFFK